MQDNFDSYADQAAFEAAWGVVGALPSGTLSTAQSASTPNSIRNAGTTDNAQANRNQRSFAETGLPNIGLDNVILFSFDFYDSNAALHPFRHHNNLQDSPATGNGQLVAMGMNNNQLRTDSGGNYYMGRILGYNPNETGAMAAGAFFKLNGPGAPLRSTGWHNLAVEISEVDYRFFVDGVLSEVVSNTFTLRSYEMVRLGSGLSNANNEVFYDNVLVETIDQVRPSVWFVDANENWSGVFSWTGDVPNSTAAEAVFGSAITTPRTVTVDSPVTIGRLTLQNENAYTLAGPGPLTLDGRMSTAVVHLASGSHVISAPLALDDNTVIVGDGSLSITGELHASGVSLTKTGAGALTISGPQTLGPGAVLTVSAGTANINTNAGTNVARVLTVNANSTTNFGSTQHLAALNVGAGATATITSGGPKNVVTNALTIAGGSTPTGKLDVTNNAVIVDYPAAGPSPDATIRAQIISGRGGSGLGKTWNGQGITSSQAAADPVNSSSVGYAVAGTMPLGALATFRGQAVDASTVVMRYTRTGDANLDGVVNNDDVTVVGANYAPGFAKPRWDLGDFDYNGFVDDDDVTLLGVYYNPAATPIPAPANNGVVAVPEPASVVLLAVAGSALALGLVSPRLRRRSGM